MSILGATLDCNNAVSPALWYVVGKKYGLNISGVYACQIQFVHISRASHVLPPAYGWRLGSNVNHQNACTHTTVTLCPHLYMYN